MPGSMQGSEETQGSQASQVGNVNRSSQQGSVWGDGVGGLEEQDGEVATDVASDVARWFGASMQRRLAAFARRFVGNDDADDVAQEALIRAGHGLVALRAAGRAEAWLFRICRHAAIDHVRARRVRRAVWCAMPEDARALEALPPPAGPTPAEPDSFDELLAGLRRLPAHHRLLMSLHYLKGYSHETICRMTGLSASALRVRLFRARWVLLELRTGR